jgi:hypothetical protein
MDEETFSAAVVAELEASDPANADDYQIVVPVWHAYRGLESYWHKRREAAAGA